LPWNGQFPPQIVQIMLQNYSKQSDVIYDPFLGSGTTLLEAGGQRSEAYGTDINLAAVSLSKIYELINHNGLQRKELTDRF
jgi:DNA modification methylase